MQSEFRTATGMRKLELAARRIELEAELDAKQTHVDLTELRKNFVKHAASYAERKGIPKKAFREARRSLFVNRQFTSRIPQLRRGESDALLAHLYTWSERPEFQCRYRWTEGAIGIWDNRATQHKPVVDYEGRRQIQRVTILGDSPAGEPARWPAMEVLDSD